jgi:hypothetical protein
MTVQDRQLEGGGSMSKSIFRRRSIAVLFTTLAILGAVAAYTTATASAEGRTIDGTFCLPPPANTSPPPGHWFCMQATSDGQTTQGFCTYTGTDPKDNCNTDLVSPGGTGTASPGLLVLRPGTYWVTVHDDNDKHNFELRSCPGSSSPCAFGDGSEQEITPIVNSDPLPVPDACTVTDGTVECAIKVTLKPGWYRLFCDAQSPVPHEPRGMYVDIEVGGVGQVG